METYENEIWVNQQEEDIYNALKAFCPNVKIVGVPSSDSWDVLFTGIDLAVELKNSVKDFFSSMIDERLDEQCYKMTRNHKHSIIIVMGNIREYVMNEFDRRTTNNPFMNHVDFKTIYKQIIGYMASCVALNNIEELFTCQEIFEMSYFMLSYAHYLGNAKKIVNKKFILRRPPVPKGHLTKLNILRCIPGIEMSRAIEIEKMIELHDVILPGEEHLIEMIEKINEMAKSGHSNERIAKDLLTMMKEKTLAKLMSIKGIKRKTADKIMNVLST